MRNILANTAILALLPSLSFAGSIGVDFSSEINASQAQCLATQVDFAVIRAYNAPYGPDLNA